MASYNVFDQGAVDEQKKWLHKLHAVCIGNWNVIIITVEWDGEKQWDVIVFENWLQGKAESGRMMRRRRNSMQNGCV